MEAVVPAREMKGGASTVLVVQQVGAAREAALTAAAGVAARARVGPGVQLAATWALSNASHNHRNPVAGGTQNQVSQGTKA